MAVFYFHEHVAITVFETHISSERAPLNDDEDISNAKPLIQREHLQKGSEDFQALKFLHLIVDYCSHPRCLSLRGVTTRSLEFVYLCSSCDLKVLVRFLSWRRMGPASWSGRWRQWMSLTAIPWRLRRRLAKLSPSFTAARHNSALPSIRSLNRQSIGKQGNKTKDHMLSLSYALQQTGHQLGRVRHQPGRYGPTA